MTENSNTSSKNLKSELKNTVHYNAVETSSKNLSVEKLDAIDVSLYITTVFYRCRTVLVPKCPVTRTPTTIFHHKNGVLKAQKIPFSY